MAEPAPLPRVCIGIATRARRRGLARLLESLEAQDYAGAYRVCVVDNDPARSAGWVERDSHSLEITYVHESQVGIPHARNAVVDALHAEDDALVFIDDDEVARPDWLRHLVSAWQHHRSDGVTGPVEPYFPERPPRWVKEGGFFARRELPTGTRVSEAYTHNLLLSRTLVDQLRPLFDARMALRGGSDAHLAGRLERAGATIVWCQEAVCVEWVPRSRTTAEWLVRRSFRQGANRAFIERDLGTLRVPGWWLALGAAKVGVGGLSMLRDGRTHHGRIRSLRSMAYGVGLIAGSARLRYDEYDSVHEV
ncbi:MAG: glycosyltransferase [Myxococcota bacterium]